MMRICFIVPCLALLALAGCEGNRESTTAGADGGATPAPTAADQSAPARDEPAAADAPESDEPAAADTPESGESNEPAAADTPESPEPAAEPNSDTASDSAAAGPSMMLIDQKVKAGCAMCIFKMDDVNACVIAAEVDGQAYLVEGVNMYDHGDPHGADGMCNTARQAIVSGALKDGKLVATHFELE